MDLLRRYWRATAKKTAAIHALVLVIASGCGLTRGLPVHGMGERVEMDHVIYSVVDAEWKDKLGEGMDFLLPKNSFLLLRVTITNRGSREFFVPQFTLIGQGNKEYQELAEVKGVRDWLGVLRRVTPAHTASGWIAFDVPMGDYRLRVSLDEFESSSPKSALIEIPARVSVKPRQADEDEFRP